jgi:hypothetical protein
LLEAELRERLAAVGVRDEVIAVEVEDVEAHERDSRVAWPAAGERVEVLRAVEAEREDLAIEEHSPVGEFGW